MRKPFLSLLPVVLLVFLAAAGVAVAAGITLTGTPVSLTDCASGGSSASALQTGRSYLLTTTTETVWLCFAESSSTCAAGGTMFPAGSVVVLTMKADQVSVSCRSTLSTGDAQFTRVN